MVLVNYIDVLSLGVSEMILFLHFFWKRPINLKKFDFDKKIWELEIGVFAIPPSNESSAV